MESGVIRKIVTDKGFGFIQNSDGKPDVFFHMSALARGVAFQELQEGQDVDYEWEQGKQGPRATTVILV
jgi:CspA family cold shock protein